MKPRERVLAAINHREPDHLPMDIGGTDVTGINVRAYRRLLEHLGQTSIPDPPILDMVQQLAEPSEEFLRFFGAHCRAVYPSPPATWKLQLHGDETHDWFIDEWGITWRKPRSGGLYFDLARHPLAGASLEKISAYPWPDPEDPARQAGIVETARRIHSEGEYAVILSGLTGGGPMEVSAWIAGFENFYIAVGRNPDLADALLDRALEAKLRFWQAVLPEAGPYVDIISESEDLGTQNSLMISPRAFQRHIKPRLRQLFDGIKEAAPHVKILLHSDGAIVPILPDLIEIGVDILNPVQPECVDHAWIKATYGDRLSFSGGLGVQSVLPFGTPDEVREHVRATIATLGEGGGLIVGPSHVIERDVPMENILAMLEAIDEYGKY